MIKYKRKINMIAGSPPAPIRLNQYDSDVVLELELYSSEGILTIEEDTEVAIKGTKPDGNGVSVQGELVINQDKRTKLNTYTAIINVDIQMTTAAGVSKYKLSLTKDGRELNTGSFEIIVDRASLDKDTLPSESVIREIVDTIDRTDELLTAAKSINKAKKDIEKIRSLMDDIEAVKATLAEITSGMEELESFKVLAISDISKAGGEVLAEIDKQRETDAAANSNILALVQDAVDKVNRQQDVITALKDELTNISNRLDAIEGGDKA
jgi:prefoldin subunit 5